MAGYDLIIVGMGSAGMVAAEFAPKPEDQGRGGRGPSRRRRLPVDRLRAVQGAARLGEGGAHDAPRRRLRPDRGRAARSTPRACGRASTRSSSSSRSTDDNPDRFRAEGVDVLLGAARLTSPTTVRVGDDEHEARRILLATGSRPATPPIEGLAEAGFLTSERIFELGRAPPSLVMIGAGPISIELAQALVRLGVPVTVLQRGPDVLTRDEPELAARLRGEAARGGREPPDATSTSTASRVAPRRHEDGARRRARLERRGDLRRRRPHAERRGARARGRRREGLAARHRGRRPAAHERQDASTPRATSPGRHLFTHSAGYEAARAVRNMFLPGSSGGSFLVPWCTFTDPELAHAGLTEAQARAEHGDDAVRVWRQDLSHSDRARADSAADGEIRIVTAKGRVVGAHALAPSAGELIGELALAIDRKPRASRISRASCTSIRRSRSRSSRSPARPPTRRPRSTPGSCAQGVAR